MNNDRNRYPFWKAFVDEVAERRAAWDAARVWYRDNANRIPDDDELFCHWDNRHTTAYVPCPRGGPTCEVCGLMHCGDARHYASRWDCPTCWPPRMRDVRDRVREECRLADERARARQRTGVDASTTA